MLIKYSILKYVGICMTVFYGLAQASLFSKYLAINDFAFITIIYGVTVYSAFADFGISKPLYSELRMMYVKGQNWREEIEKVMPFIFFAIFLQNIILFGIVGYFWMEKKNNFSILFIFIFIFTIVSNSLILYIENIYNSIDDFNYFQVTDNIRRFIALVSLGFIYIDKTLYLTLLIYSLGLIIIIIMQFSRLKNNYNINLIIRADFLKNIKYIIHKYWKKSKDFLFFSVNETIIYNMGFLAFPFFYNSKEIIEYGIWVKIFVGSTLLMGVIGLAYNHAISRHYLSMNELMVKVKFIQSFMLSIIFIVIFMLILYLGSDYIFLYWLDNKYKLNNIFFISLAIWCVGNACQHVSGTFLMSIGTEFQFLKISSLYILIIMTCSTLLSLNFRLTIDKTLFVNSLVYLIGSLFYLKQAFKKMNLHV